MSTDIISHETVPDDAVSGELISNEIISGQGYFLALIQTVPEEHRAAAKNLLTFFRDSQAYSKNTLIAFRRATEAWITWCREKSLPWFPLADDDVRDYLLELHNRGLASSTVSARYQMLNMLVRQCGLPPLTERRAVSLVMRRIRREAVTEKRERTGQAIPFQWEDLKLADVLMARNGTLISYRDRAFLFLAYNTLMRMSELSRVRVGDLDMTGDTVILHISHTKTSVTAAGLSKQLAHCTAQAVSDWLARSGLGDKPDALLFPAVRRGGHIANTVRPLSAPAIERIFSGAWALLNKTDVKANKGRYKQWTGHSARVGAAVDMANKGVAMVEIMREGTWKKPETLMRYLRGSLQQKSTHSTIMDENIGPASL